ncbi:transmembrane protein 225B [Pipistrellus kuhlii]|uniref:Transmembrane protein 225B n=1 Tax=Pipistrellus kuhlii TaxID=59472 RepID=A0A7J7YZA5_PIPKU|nr:transmembrane protein 225B [Pipistrellus kuhlii]KAF6367234.1 transmembrane protein 225B [Pipistrellus kuhlii]
MILTSESKDIRSLTWAIACTLTVLGYLLILLVTIFPFWVRLVNEESREVFNSGLFENCFHTKCLKPRPLPIYIILSRVFLLSAVGLSFLTTLTMASFASQLFPRTWRQIFISVSCSFFTGACAFLALLLHALEIQSLRMQPNPPQVSVQWPYYRYVLGFGILLFIAAGVICLFQEACRRLRISQSMMKTRESPHLEILESLGGLSALQKEILLKEEMVI